MQTDVGAKKVVVPKPGALNLTQQITASTVGSVVTCVVVNPLDVMKTRLQLRTTSYGGWAHVTSFIRNEGARSLFSGLPVALLMTIPANIIYFTIYERLRTKFEASNKMNSTSAVALAGACGRVAAVIATSPLEYIRTVLQAQLQDQAFDILKANLATRGWSTLFVGLYPTLLRDVPFSIIYWAGYERGKHFAGRLLPLRNFSTTTADAMHNFAAGVGSALVAATVTTPLDVIKTRRQVASNTLLSHQHDLRVGAIFRHILLHEGVRGLFHGVVPRVIKVAPACAIMITSYELVKKKL
eukprot:c4866_g1_i2.p1 GENE.c4866_g1_i2~~c4866_g1_i2.p1  ORF type:complete len:307 (-),score=47.25 c4866_g1_i2:138-1031(-)